MGAGSTGKRRGACRRVESAVAVRQGGEFPAVSDGAQKVYRAWYGLMTGSDDAGSQAPVGPTPPDTKSRWTTSTGASRPNPLFSKTSRRSAAMALVGSGAGKVPS